MYAHHFSHKPLRVREAIVAWDPIPEDNTFLFSQLEVQTDGSALLSKGWSASPVNAGWGAVCFAIFLVGLQTVLGC